MKKRILALLLVLSFVVPYFTSFTFAADEVDYSDTEWNGNPDVFQVNREPFHVTSIPYKTHEIALDMANAPVNQRSYRVDSDYVLNLNGEWDFHFGERVSEKAIQTNSADPEAFTGSEYQQEISWDKISVPMTWQQVYDETTGQPKYDYTKYGMNSIASNDLGVLNISTDSITGKVDPDQISVGTYRRNFEISPDWNGREIYISFNGVATAFYVWVNGNYVGYSEDSRAIAQFNVTDYVTTGSNQIVVEVYRGADSEWMEVQDMLRLSGIHRDVYLYSVDKNATIRDYAVVTDLDDTYTNSTLSVRAYIHSNNNVDFASANYKVTASLYDGDELIESFDIDPASARIYSENELLENGDYTSTDWVNAGETEIVVEASTAISAPKLWSAETPNLYNLVLTLYNGTEAIESVSSNIGFKKYEVKTAPNGKEYLTVNGERVVFYGYNRHDMSLEYGYQVPYDQIVREMEQLKQLNTNAVRTSHYMNDPAVYELFDQYGFYVISESNVESHEQNQYIPQSVPEWRSKVIECQKANVIVQKNHASILMWSLGNESDTSPWFLDSYDWIKGYDSTRTVHYDPESSQMDVFSTMYTGPRVIKTALDNASLTQPRFLVEYCYTMINGRSNIYTDYIDTNFITDYVNWAGGFIWSFHDTSTIHYYEDALTGDYKPFAGTQTDWGDRNSMQALFSGSLGTGSLCGIIDPYGVYKPEATEAKYAYQQVWYKNVDLESGRVEVENRYLFTDLNQFDMTWKLVIGEEEKGGGTQTVELPAAQTITDDGKVVYNSITVALSGYADAIESAKADLRPGQSLYLRIFFHHKDDNAPQWAKTVYDNAPHAVAFEEICEGDASIIDGMEVAREEFLVQEIPAEEIDLTQVPDIIVTEEDDLRIITADAGSAVITFDSGSGMITSYKLNDAEMLMAPVKPDFTRAYTISAFNYVEPNLLFPIAGARWRNPTQEITAIQTTRYGSKAIQFDVDSKLHLSNNAQVDAVFGYMICGDGSIYLSTEITVPALNAGVNNGPLELGYQLHLPESFQNIQYYGRGATENWTDRNYATQVGIYESTVKGQYFPYTADAGVGSRTDLRWLALTDDSGDGLLFTSDNNLMQSTVLNFTAQEINDNDRPWKLQNLYKTQSETERKTVVDLSHRSRGMGNEFSQTTRVAIDQGMYSYSFGIRPISASMDLDDIYGMYRVIQKDLGIILDVAVDGKSVYVPGTDSVVYPINPMDYEVRGEAAIPEVTATVVEGAEVSIEPADTVPGNTVVVATKGEEEQIFTVNFVLDENNYLSDLSPEYSSGDVKIDHFVAGEVSGIKVREQTGNITQYDKGVALRHDSEVIYDISNHVTQGYDQLVMQAGMHSDMEGVAYGTFLSNQYVAELEYDILLDDEIVAYGNANVEEVEGEFIATSTDALVLDLTDAQTLTLRVRQVNKDGNLDYADTWLCFADARFSLGSGGVTPPEDEYDITVNGGTASQAKAKEGETITLAADAEADNEVFTGWTSDDVEIQNANSKNDAWFVMPAQNVTVTANFEPIPEDEYRITISGGWVEDERFTAAEGEEITITADESLGLFQSWSFSPSVDFVDGYDENDATTSFYMPARDVSITAKFVYTLTVEAGEGGSLSEDVDGNYAADERIQVEAIPDDGYEFSGWTAEGYEISNPNNSRLTVTMPARNVSITANFKEEGGEDPDPGPDPRPSTSRGTSRGGGNGRSSGGWSAPSTPSAWGAGIAASVVSDVTQATAVEAVKTAVSGGATYVRFQNPGKITLSTMQAMVAEAGDTALTIYADSMNGSAVDVRLYVDPAKATGDINLAASTVSTRATSLKTSFANWFNNELLVLCLEQDGPFGQPVEIAVKLNETLQAGEELVLYSYNSATNTYSRLADQSYRIDANGYIRFNIIAGGSYIISDGALARK